MTARIRPGRRVVGATVVTMAGLATWAGTAPPAAADAPTVYQIVARADALSAEYVQPGIPALPGGQVLFFSPSTASSSLGSLDTPRAFAAAPFPGDFVVSGPGTLNGLTGTTLPPYPTYTYAEYPTVPESNVNQGPIDLQTASRPDETSAHATLRGFDGGSGFAFARSAATSRSHLAADGASVAEATAVVEGITLPGELYIGQVMSTVLVQRPADGGQITRTTQTTISGATVGGVPVSITPAGLALGRTGAPAPLADATALTALLEQDGVRLGLTPSSISPDGVVSSALAITLTRNQHGQGPVQVDLLFGRASASDSTQASSAAPAAVTPNAQSGPAVNPGAGAGGVADGVGAPAAIPAPLGSVPADVPQAAAPALFRVAPAAVASAAAPRFDSDWFYGVLVLAAAVAVGSTVAVWRAVPQLLPGSRTGA